MSRQPRSGRAAHPVTVRATTAERASWKRAAKAEGCTTLSAWVVKALNERATKTPAARRKRKRCPDCNQLLHILNENGSIEPHMRMLGDAPVVCLNAARVVPNKARRSGR